MLSPLLAANFGPGPEAAAEGRAAGQGVCFFCFSQPTSGLARRERQRGTQVDGKFAFHRLWESPTTSARRQWRLGIWTKSLHPCASRHRVRADGGLAGRTAAAAGSCWTCWRSQECSAPSPFRVLCCRLCLTYTHTHKNRHGKKWPDTLRSPLGQLAWRERLRRSTYCCCGKPQLLDCCWNICTCWFVSVHIWFLNVRRLDDSLLPRRRWVKC